MRIVGGRLKGIQFQAPAKLPVRPTTDMAKEALFNILLNSYDFEECKILDLFTGTGNISIEFASRNAQSITSVDKHPACVAWLKSVKEKHQLVSIDIRKADVFKFLTQSTEKYDIIFADPPYDLPNIPLLPQLVHQHQLLNQNGVLVVEHPSMLKLEQQPGYTETRKYGYSSFSFFTS
ncbi:RsmD family RNA methyltransferase [Pedobacter sp. SL55]|uniref:RsmD family RNA methyltransferase n=1 Tax=Pedobacter sp. SL55 TaxID=2995161 RepID=UPI00226DE2D0|nr:RsmD family RNA methyltransferase [Pedobacter sp. SL55]WAC40090.1 RsmD family RNA methyltransferase [Pedobacter sp. SL55]